MSFRSFDSTVRHPFVEAMETFVTVANQMAVVPKWLRFLFRSKQRKCIEACKMLKNYLADVVSNRKEKLTKSPGGSMPDLLEVMLEGTDDLAGKSMSAAHIALQATRLAVARAFASAHRNR